MPAGRRPRRRPPVGSARPRGRPPTDRRTCRAGRPGGQHMGRHVRRVVAQHAGRRRVIGVRRRQRGRAGAQRAVAAQVPTGTADVVGYWAALGDVMTPARLDVRGAGGDLCCDGTLGSRTAARSAPYADDATTTGVLRHNAADVAAHVLATVAAGLQPGYHVIGDAAVEAALDGLEQAAAQVGAWAVRASRPRLEHVEMASPATVARMAALGAVASVQPAFDAAWGGRHGMYADRLGADRAAELNPLAAFAAAGVPLAFGSDAPVTRLDPWGGVRAAVHPRNPEHALSARAAFAAATRGGWRAAGRDGAGELAPGAPATYAVWTAGQLRVQVPDERVAGWSTDPRAAVAGLPDLSPGATLPTCVRTVVRGRLAYVVEAG